MTNQLVRKQPAWVPFAVAGGAVVVVASVVMILVAALSTGGPGGQTWHVSQVPTVQPSRTFSLTGEIVVPANVASFVPDGGCIADRGYDDIGTGAGVTVRDASGVVLAVGELKAGRMRSLKCAYAFTVPGVPRDAQFYQVEVAGRGSVSFEEDVAVAGAVSLTLG